MGLKIAVDARVIAQDTRGIGRYERAILRRLVARDDVELTLLNFGPFPARHRRACARALESERFDVSSRVRSSHDLVWHPANGTFFASAKPSVVTIHDAVPFREPNPDAKTRLREQNPFRASVRSAARFVAVSEFGKSEIVDVFGVRPELVSVIYHGVEDSFSPGEPESLPDGVTPFEYVLFVGDTAEPRKNFALLYEAFSRAWPAFDGPSLVVAGPKRDALRGVVHLGELSDDLASSDNARLRALYRGALALALASRHETFGMPAVEAMACGAPVIASAASCLPEICADAALFAGADDATGWSERLRNIASDEGLRSSLRDRGLRRARFFDWDASAEAHLDVFTQAVRG